MINILKDFYYMMSIHLSDNGITKDDEFFYDCCEEFQITEEDLIEINRSKRTEIKIHPSMPNKYDKLDIDYKQYLKEYFEVEVKVDDHKQHDHGK